jgi:hypothetical protein
LRNARKKERHARLHHEGVYTKRAIGFPGEGEGADNFYFNNFERLTPIQK